MEQICGLLLLTGVVPLYRLWRGSAGMPLRHPIAWASLAWLVGCWAWLTDGSAEKRYLFLAMTTCAGVAVLGARRPGVIAWNFVVVGLLAVLCRPYLQGLGELKLETVHLVFLGVSLVVGIGNYLPTRQVVTALLLAGWCGVELAALAGLVQPPSGVMPLLLALVPWLGLMAQRGKPNVWRSFRDAYGFLWSQRLREQFARSVANSGLQVELRWSGLHGEDESRGRELLRSMLRRFYASTNEDDSEN